MKYRVKGADRETGAEIDTIIEASGEDDLYAQASARGILIESAHAVDIPHLRKPPGLAHGSVMVPKAPPPAATFSPPPAQEFAPPAYQPAAVPQDAAPPAGQADGDVMIDMNPPHWAPPQMPHMPRGRGHAHARSHGHSHALPPPAAPVQYVPAAPPLSYMTPRPSDSRRTRQVVIAVIGLTLIATAIVLIVLLYPVSRTVSVAVVPASPAAVKVSTAAPAPVNPLQVAAPLPLPAVAAPDSGLNFYRSYVLPGWSQLYFWNTQGIRDNQPLLTASETQLMKLPQKFHANVLDHFVHVLHPQMGDYVIMKFAAPTRLADLGATATADPAGFSYAQKFTPDSYVMADFSNNVFCCARNLDAVRAIYQQRQAGGDEVAPLNALIAITNGGEHMALTRNAAPDPRGILGVALSVHVAPVLTEKGVVLCDTASSAGNIREFYRKTLPLWQPRITPMFKNQKWTTRNSMAIYDTSYRPDEFVSH